MNMEIEHVFLNIVIILAAARILGEVFRRMKQPALVGEILAGMILGPTLFGILQTDKSFDVLSSIAVFFLMLLAGLEMDLREIKKAGKSAVAVSLIAFTVPFLVGSQVASLFGLSTVESLFMGLLLSITAVPVSAIVLMEFGILKSKIGNTVMTAAVINDILALVVLGVILQMSANVNSQLDLSTLGVSVIKVVAFVAIMALLSLIISKTSHLFPNKIELFFDKLQSREAVFGILLVLSITVSLFAQYNGLHFIIGTFFAGLIFSKKLLPRKQADRAYGIVSGITFGFFAPLFFGFIGIEFNAKSIIDYIPLFVALLAVAITTKIGGGFIGAKISKFSNNDSLAIGTLMNGRGMIELAIAAIGLTVGILNISLFSIAVAIGFVTTILAPLLARPFIIKAKLSESGKVTERDTEKVRDSHIVNPS